MPHNKDVAPNHREIDSEKVSFDLGWLRDNYENLDKLKQFVSNLKEAKFGNDIDLEPFLMEILFCNGLLEEQMNDKKVRTRIEKLSELQVQIKIMGRLVLKAFFSQPKNKMIYENLKMMNFETTINKYANPETLFEYDDVGGNRKKISSLLILKKIFLENHQKLERLSKELHSLNAMFQGFSLDIAKSTNLSVLQEPVMEMYEESFLEDRRELEMDDHEELTVIKDESSINNMFNKLEKELNNIAIRSEKLTLLKKDAIDFKQKLKRDSSNQQYNQQIKNILQSLEKIIHTKQKKKSSGHDNDINILLERLKIAHENLNESFLDVKKKPSKEKFLRVSEHIKNTFKQECLKAFEDKLPNLTKLTREEEAWNKHLDEWQQIYNILNKLIYFIFLTAPGSQFFKRDKAPFEESVMSLKVTLEKIFKVVEERDKEENQEFDKEDERNIEIEKNPQEGMKRGELK